MEWMGLDSASPDLLLNSSEFRIFSNRSFHSVLFACTIAFSRAIVGMSRDRFR